MELKGIELFRVGRWNDIKTFNRADLDAMADSFAALRLGGRVPLKFGHNDSQPLTDGQPALGWVDRVYVEGDVLKGDFTDLPRSVYEAIKAGRYKFVSIELLRDVMAGNKEYSWVLSAVALLGADIPAVSGLRDLQALTHSRRAGFPTGTPMVFTTGGRQTMTETEKLQAEVNRLNTQVVEQAQDTAIREGRCIAAERERFSKRYGKAGTLDDWQDWLKNAQRPPAHTMSRQGAGRTYDSRGESNDNMPEGGSPDSELVALAQAEVEKSDGKLDYFAAQRKVLRANPALAEAYRSQPGVKDT